MGLEEVKQKKKRKKRGRFVFRVSIIGALLGAVVFTLVSNIQADNTIYRAGDQAPDFKLQQINESNERESVQLSDLEGKGVMLNFWGTWCKPCEREMPYMQELYGKYKDKGIEIVAVSLDSTELVVDRFVDRHNLTFPVPHDTTEEVRDLYKVGPLPSTFFINPEGEIVEYVEGALTLESLEGHLQNILPEA
ncbi:thiol-disulfide oxidoreductase ResA [Lentibacillus sediminis]|uniref:thiol-disulfide oxidoreductase ResA n=1 Tax=Lentibacillus sediminis TaxID=1940529 RepID=UPI000C1B8B5D|nr:thiol-disulfide oxidoreductase ResA [Lentibacillus sediminis]